MCSSFVEDIKEDQYIAGSSYTASFAREGRNTVRPSTGLCNLNKINCSLFTLFRLKISSPLFLHMKYAMVRYPDSDIFSMVSTESPLKVTQIT